MYMYETVYTKIYIIIGLRQAHTRQHILGSGKVLSICPIQADSPAGQVTVYCYLPYGKEPRQVVCQLNKI